MRAWKRRAAWAYIVVLHLVPLGAVAAWASGRVGLALDTYHVSIQTVRSEDVAKTTGLDWGPGLRSHVVRYKDRKVLVIHEGKDSLDQIDVSPPGSKLVWHYASIPTEITKLPSELTVDVLATDDESPLDYPHGTTLYVLLDSDADGMPESRKEAGLAGAFTRLRCEPWVPKDHPDAMPDPK